MLCPACVRSSIRAGELPPWIDNRLSSPALRVQYGELLEAVVTRYRDDIAMWWIGGEVNMGGDGLGWDEWKDWMGWQSGLIKGIDPNATVAVSFGSWTGYHEQIPPNAIHEVDGTLELVERGVDFDVVAIEYHFGTLQNGSIEELRQAVEDLKAAGKEIFIWEVYYPGAGDPAYQDGWGWAFPPAAGYSEAWQSEQMLETLILFHDDPKIIGFNMFHLVEIGCDDIDPEDGEAGWRCYAGLIGSDGTPKAVYFAVKAYWDSVSTKYN